MFTTSAHDRPGSLPPPPCPACSLATLVSGSPCSCFQCKPCPSPLAPGAEGPTYSGVEMMSRGELVGTVKSLQSNLEEVSQR